jgi:hypothetical protein
VIEATLERTGAKPVEEDAAVGSPNSSSYLVSPSDPAEVAAKLGVTGAKLIGSNIVGSLRFESNDRERVFLAEAGDTFCFPLMERRFMRAGLENMLQSAQDLALKSFVASRYAAHQLRLDDEKSSRLSKLEKKMVALEKEKAELEAALSLARDEVDSNVK